MEHVMAELVVVRHPIRGLLWGLVFGIGLAFVLVFSTIIVFARVPVTTTIAIGTVAGLMWSVVGPPRTTKSPPPEPATATSQNTPE